METKKCTRCKEIKLKLDFHKDIQKKDGLSFRCKKCKIELALKWNTENKEKHLKTVQKSRTNNPLLHQNANKKYYIKNPTVFKAKNSKRRSNKLNQTPPWLTAQQKQQIKEIYANCPPGHHVDHIIPLKGKEVRGLHVPWNLQYLPATENLRKSNKV